MPPSCGSWTGPSGPRRASSRGFLHGRSAEPSIADGASSGMGVSDMAPIHLNDDVALFREALTYTAAETGFIARLIEKDYFCTVLLQYMAEERYGLVFRGGTCLAKVHSGFYRLSEDLDFLIPTPVDASRAERGRRVAASKEAV